MENANKLREKLRSGQIPLGCGVSFTDPTVSELFSYVLDFVWIDMDMRPPWYGQECLQGRWQSD